MERPPFEASLYYHVYNRGTEKRLIFLNDADYLRFLLYLYVCNDTAPIKKIRGENPLLKKKPVRGETSDKREMLVDIVAYTLMPNHFHLLLCPKTDNGLSRFMQKILTAYTMYFNKKYDRTGALFQGLFKSKEVTNEQYLPVLARYIHLNPVKPSKINKNNLIRGLASDKGRIEDFLKRYKWSSCADYLGVKNFPTLLTPDLFWEIFEDEEEHKEFLLEDAGELEDGEDPELEEIVFEEE